MNYQGCLLIAPPGQEDKFWSKSVIFLYEQTKYSTVGVILNKQSNRTVSELAEHYDYVYDSDEPIFIGGPDNHNALIMLHSADWACPNTMQIGTVRISSDYSIIKRLANGDRPSKWKLFMGMSTWDNGQLDAEIKGLPPYSKKTSWLLAPMSKPLLFENNSNKVWRKSIDLAVKIATEAFF